MPWAGECHGRANTMGGRMPSAGECHSPREVSHSKENCCISRSRKTCSMKVDNVRNQVEKNLVF
jgi:hypothetical protein